MTVMVSVSVNKNILFMPGPIADSAFDKVELQRPGIYSYQHLY